MDRTLLQAGATQWTQSLVNHQIGYLKPGLSRSAGQQGLFDLEKSNKERVASLVGDYGKWNKKINDLRSDWWMNSGEVRMGAERACERKMLFLKEVEYIWHQFII